MKMRLTWNERKEIRDAAQEISGELCRLSSHMRLVAEPTLIDDAVQRLRDNGIPCSRRMLKEAV